ncbi:hypothetical protein Peur_046174 [Populus x canadensis]
MSFDMYEYKLDDFRPNTWNTMKLGSLFRNRSLLELVHPGGFAEIRKKSISAAEVMKKNPRHFITRPDFHG